MLLRMRERHEEQLAALRQQVDALRAQLQANGVAA